MSTYLNWLGDVGIRLSLAVCYDASAAYYIQGFFFVFLSSLFYSNLLKVKFLI